MNIDHAIITFLNQAAQHWAALDETIVFLSNSDLLKGGVIVAVFWGAWFRADANQDEARRSLLSAVLGAIVALFIARVLAYVIPFRVRPLLNPVLHFRAPLGLPDQSNWTIWSSFPSDHAALFCALAYGVWQASRRAGIILLLYMVIVVLTPRVYVGIHYPSDLVAGALIGFVVSAALDTQLLRRLWAGPLLAVSVKRPGLFYGVMFFLTREMADLFYDVRTVMALFNFYT